MAGEHLLRVQAYSEVDGRRRMRAGRADVAAIVVPARRTWPSTVAEVQSERLPPAASAGSTSRGAWSFVGGLNVLPASGDACNGGEPTGGDRRRCRCWRRGVELSRIRLRRPGGLRESRVSSGGCLAGCAVTVGAAFEANRVRLPVQTGIGRSRRASRPRPMPEAVGSCGDGKDLRCGQPQRSRED